MPLRKGLINRQPADWVSYEDEDTGKPLNEFVAKGKEREYFLLWKARHQAERDNDQSKLQIIDKHLDQMTDWPATRKYGHLNDQQMNMVDQLRLNGASDAVINRKLLDPMAVVRPEGMGELSELPNTPIGGTPEELQLAEDEWEAMQPVGTGTGVDPRKLPGEWQNGVLEIPSTEGGKGLRIDLNNQPYMNKRKKK